MHITTTRPDGSYRRWTPIYVVPVGDGLYIRSGGGRTSDWYHHATQHNRARIRAGGIEADVTLHEVADPALSAQVDAACQAKDGISPASTAYLFAAPAAEATLRLDN